MMFVLLLFFSNSLQGSFLRMLVHTKKHVHFLLQIKILLLIILMEIWHMLRLQLILICSFLRCTMRVSEETT
jgi:hypothetical protein